MTDIVGELIDRLEAAQDLDEWADALLWIIDMLFENMDFFRLARAQPALAAPDARRPFDEMQEHLQMHERVEAAVHDTAADLPEEIRMFAALGAVTAFDDWAPKLLAQAPPEVIQAELAAAVRATLGLPKRRTRHLRAAAATYADPRRPDRLAVILSGWTRSTTARSRH